VTWRFAVAAVLLLAGGCATTLPPPGDSGDWPARREALQALGHWSLDGRIAVAAGEDGFSGGFDWVQTGELAEVELSGPMGGSAINIRVEGEAAAVSVGGQGASAENAEALLARYFGPDRKLPAGQMRYWLLGVPAPNVPFAETLGEDLRLATLAQSGWQVRFDRYQAVGTIALPARLEMTTEGLRLRVVVSEWRVPP
jgi:outer membrane lipoprotein LolB